jgi:hypothetical protein
MIKVLELWLVGLALLFLIASALSFVAGAAAVFDVEFGKAFAIFGLGIFFGVCGQVCYTLLQTKCDW